MNSNLKNMFTHNNGIYVIYYYLTRVSAQDNVARGCAHNTQYQIVSKN